MYAEVLFPDVHRQIIELKRLVPAKVKNMDKAYRDVIGIRIMEPLMEVVRNYSEMTHGDTEVKVAAEKMMRELDMMLAARPDLPAVAGNRAYYSQSGDSGDFCGESFTGSGE